MKFDKKFLEDEVRLGFLIPASVKQAWAAELEILEVIDNICKQNNISYFADWGTLLGAVRHAGFVPWDDDMDLVMLREDYDRFLQIAPSLLPEGYCVHTFRNTDNFVEFHAVVTNTESSRFDEKHFNDFHGFPFIAGVDIFVLDYIYEDEAKEQKRVEETTYIIAFADGLLAGKFNEETRNSGLDKIDKISGTHIDRTLPDKQMWIQLYELAERKCAEVSSEESNTLTQMVPWGLKQIIGLRFPASDYQKITYTPFEYTSIPIPLYANKMLTRRYGNYMHFIKSAGAHDYPCFATQKRDLENLLGHKINACNYFAPYEREEHNSWKDTVNECLDNLAALSQTISADSVCNAQSLAVEMGNFIEAVQSDRHPAVKSVEEYCEKLYQLYMAITENSDVSKALEAFAQTADNYFKELANSLNENLLSRKEIVFVTYDCSNLACMEALINKYMQDDKCDVYILPIPYYFKNYDGTLSDERFNINDYPESYRYLSYENYSLEFHHPDVIITANPYDEYNPATSIHPDFYSTKLRNYSNELIYVSPISTYDFDSTDERSYINMDTYVTMPALVNADKIVVQSPALRNTYISKLTEWAGPQTQNLWENKVIAMSNAHNESEKTHKKKLLYYVSGTTPLEEPDTFISKTQNNISILRNQSKNISPAIIFDPLLEDNLNRFDPTLCKAYRELMTDIKGTGEFIFPKDSFSKDNLDEYDAFYGDAGSIASEFIASGKPVMIQNYNI